jgi:probable F420-dependent oxidoreductase
MQIGVHLPQIAFNEEPITLERLVAVATTAERLGFSTLAANDHFVWARPWLDGLATLAAVAPVTSQVRLMTSVALPVLRGPFALAKALAAIDLLSGGRLDARLGPGSSPADLALAGVAFEDRWTRCEEAVRSMRVLLDPDRAPFVGRVYDTTGVELAPRPAQPGGPPIWIGSLGSSAGLRRVVRLADGWLASGYNTTPEDFGAALRSLQDMLAAEGRDAKSFPTAMATTWLFLTDDHREARTVRESLSQLLRRPLEEIAARLPIGSSSACVDLLGRYQEAGLGRVLVWPLGMEMAQLERLALDVMPQLARPRLIGQWSLGVEI